MANYLKIRLGLDGNSALYGALTDQQVADSLNTQKSVVRKSISGSELFSYTDAAEYGALSDLKKQQWLGLCGIDSITSAAVPLIKSLFPSNSVTWGAIVKTETVTRAQELGLSVISAEDIRIARAQ